MIDVKIISKPKNEGSTSAVNTGSTAYGSMAVKEAAHAAKADIAETAKEAEHAKTADKAKEAEQAGESKEAAHAKEAEHAKEADHALTADDADKWDNRQFDDYLDQSVRKGDDVAFASVETDVVRSAGRFVDGLLGEGFKLWKSEDGTTCLCLDRLTVRQTMTVLELLIQKVRSVGGMICVSAANGTVKSVEEDGDYYTISFEEANAFVVHDLMRCQTFTGNAIKSYWVEVAEIGKDYVKVAKTEFSEALPEASDEVVLMGNTTDRKRQDLILISATEDGQPRVDVLDGVSGKSFAGALRARLGNLDGINDDAFPADRQPKGNGLYSDNAYLKGTFLLSTGEDVKTRFEIMEGKVESELTGIRDDFTGERGYLSNAAFAEGMSKWETENEAVFFLVGNRWVWANGNVLSKKGDCASVAKDEGRTVVVIRNKYISQKKENLRSIPTFMVNTNGEKQPVAVYLSFFYKCRKAGKLRVEFENVDKTGFEAFNSFMVEEDLGETDSYKQYTCNGLWNGTGDFKLSFTGEICLYMLVLSTDKVESLAYKYRTLLEQSEKLMKIAAQDFDKDGRVLEESGIVVRPEGSGVYAQTADGKLALIGVAVTETGADGKQHTVIKLTAENIQMGGLVTANGNFKIKEDGSMEAVNGKFSGEMNAQRGYIGNFIISDGHLGIGVASTDESGKTTIKENGNGLFLYDYMIGFNAPGRQAILGTWNSLGSPVLCRLMDTHKDLLDVTGLVVGVQGSLFGNDALHIAGGYVSGLAYKPQIAGFGNVTSQTAPTSATVNVDRTTVVLYVTTKFSWRAKEKDDKGNDVAWETKTRDMNVNLPEMQHYDDGHTLKIKRGTNNGNKVYVVPGKSHWMSLSDDGRNYLDNVGQSCILTDRGSYVTDKLTIDSEMDSMELVYFRDLMVTIDTKAYHGIWVQFKNPRDW